MLKKGQVVKVYEDPITCDKLEEKATLVRSAIPFVDPSQVSGAACEYWWVNFPDSDGNFLRWINKTNH